MNSDDTPMSGKATSGESRSLNVPAAEPADSPYRAHLAAEAAADEAGVDGIRGERGPALLDWKARWDALGSGAKLRIKQAALAGAVGVLGYGLYSASTGSEKDSAPAPAASKLDMGAGLRGDSLEEKLRGDFKKVIDGQQLLGDRISAIEEGKIVPHGAMPAGDAVDSGDLPPALPGSAPAFPPSPAGVPGADAALPSAPVPPAPPAAPPAPPVEKVVGSIGGATSPVLP